MTSIAATLLFVVAFAPSNAVQSTPAMIAVAGGPAARGDNCSVQPVAIGLPLAGAAQHPIDGSPLSAFNNAATISNQSVIAFTASSVSGTQPIGFVIGTKGDGYFFVPILPVGLTLGRVRTVLPGVAIYPLPGPNVNAPADIKAMTHTYNVLAKEFNATIQPWLRDALSAGLSGSQSTFSVTNCFTAPLPKFG